MIKVGITGQAGFVGTHLYNFLNICDNIELVSFNDEYFDDMELLSSFVRQCDTIIHLAAMNRHSDPNVIYDTNIELVEKLIKVLRSENVTPHIIFSSSTQENLDNLYGKSKYDGRMLLENWADSVGASLTALIVPNVFGPFGKPNYNSFIATFCNKLVNNEKPTVINDSEVRLIYVQELVDVFYRVINKNISDKRYEIPYTFEIKVSKVLELLENYKEKYFVNHIFPELNNIFEINLFNTFRSFIDVKNHYPVSLTKHSDDRGAFVETVKLEIGGQVSFSSTKPDIVRGNHYHIRKIERFAVIKGKALIQLRRIGTDEVFEYYLNGETPSFVDMPIWYTHNIKNIGDEELYTIFWINEIYNQDDPDTYFEEV